MERKQLEEVLGACTSVGEGERTALMYAIDSENMAAARTLLSYYKMVDKPEKLEKLACMKAADESSALIIAINEKNAEVVEMLISLLPKEALKETYQNKSPLKLALKAADPDSVANAGLFLPETTVEKLVDARFQSVVADQNSEEDRKELSERLDDAVNFGLFGVVKNLLYQGAKATKASTAAAAGDIEYFETSKDLKEDTINEINLLEDDSGSTYLMLACRAGSIEFVDYLLDRFSDHVVADVAHRDNGETALITAAKYGHAAIVKKLIKWAEKPHKSNLVSSILEARRTFQKTYSDGEKTIETDMEVKDADQMEGRKLVAGERLSVLAKAKDGTTVLHGVCAMTSVEPKEMQDIVTMLNKVITQALAAQMEHEYCVKHNKKRSDVEGVSPIKVKESKKHFTNLANDNGDTALDLAVRKQNIELAMSLKLSWGATVGFRSSAVIGSITEFRTLLDQANNVDECDPTEGFTALHLVCRASRIESPGCDVKANLILERGADPSKQTANGWSPLMFACLAAELDGKVSTVQALIDAGSSLNLTNSNGETALILTLKERTNRMPPSMWTVKPFGPRQILCAAMLVGGGADIKHTDSTNFSAYTDCSVIAGKQIEDEKALENAAQVFATMVQAGVDLSSTSSGTSTNSSAAMSEDISGMAVQRGFILPGFSLESMSSSAVLYLDLVGDTHNSRGIILRAYAAMSTAELSRCATMAFIKDGLDVVMMKGIWLSHLADVDARRMDSVDEGEAALLSELSSRMQLSVAALLSIKLDESTSIGGQPACIERYLKNTCGGDAFLKACSKYRMKAVLAHPIVQQHAEALWWGWMYEKLRKTHTPLPTTYLIVVLCTFVQLVLSPIVGLFPFIGRTKLLSRCFGVPIVDFAVATILNVAFTSLLMIFVQDSDNFTFAYVLMVWAVVDLWAELVELTDAFSWSSIRAELGALIGSGRSEYLIDPFNTFDLASVICASVGLVLHVVQLHANSGVTFYHWAGGNGKPAVAPPLAASDDPTQWMAVRALFSLAVFFGWMRLLRTLSVNEKMGPFVLMFLEMFYDIFQWIVLTCVIMLSTASAQYIIHSTGTPRDFHPTSCGDVGTPFVRFPTAFLRIVEGSLTSSPEFDCMAAYSEYGSFDFIFTELYAVGFQLIVGLLLVNMLIAKMAKTFDAIWENQGMNFMYMRARTVLMWNEATIVASPFLALSWPTLVLAKIVGLSQWAARLQVGSSKVQPAESDSSIHGEDSISKELDIAAKAGALLSRSGTVRSILTTMNQRIALREPLMPDRELVGNPVEIEDAIAEWILDHEDEVSQSERWRTQMQRRNAKRFDRIEKKVNMTLAGIKELKRSIAGNQDNQRDNRV